MIRAIQQFFETNLQLPGGPSDGYDVDHRMKLATAALLIETSQADFDAKPEEIQAVGDSLCEFFDIDATEMDEIMSLAEQEAADSVSLHQFTSLINQHYSMQQRIEIIEMMWRVSYSDGHKDAHEDHLIRKVAGLLYVPHREFIAAKLRAQKLAS